MHPTPADAVAAPLLKTKFFVPARRTRCIERPRLFERLEAPCPLTLVSALAGFGKTTLVSDWLQGSRSTAGWLSLDPADSEPRRFLSYLVGAVGEALAEPGPSEELGALLRTPQLPPVETLLTPLINELSRRAAKLVLVLDDYHVIDHPEIHAMVDLLVERLPPGARLVIATRTEPPLALPRMRARGLLREVRAEDLRFNSDEIAAFLAEVMELAVEPPQAAVLAERTEGWIAALQLAALSLRGQDGVETLLDGLSDTHRYVFDYLAGEVLAGLAPDEVDFLLAASVSERLSAPLCEALTGYRDAQGRLEALEADNLFVVPLDGHRSWYRFHHLFRSFLEKQLEKRKSETERCELHRRACDWFRARGLVDEAVQQALAARDRQRTLDLLEEHVEDRFRAGDVGTVVRWFDALEPDWAASRPRLAVDRGLALFLVLRWQEMAESLEISKRLLAEDAEAASEQELAGKQAALESFLATTRAEPELAARLARRALDLLPEGDVLLRSGAAVNLGSALIASDAYEEARPILREAVRGSRAIGDRLSVVVAGHLEGQIEFVLGRLQGALACYRRTSEMVSPNGDCADPFTSLLLAGEAEVCLEWGELDRARELAEQAVEASANGAFPVATVRGLMALAGVHRSRGKVAQATEAVSRLEQLLASANLVRWGLMSETHRARIWCLEARLFDNRQAKARLARFADEHRLLEAGDVGSRLLPDMPKEAALACAVRLLLMRGESDRALEMLAALRAEAEAKGWLRARIETWLLEAQARRQDGEGARAALRQALELAAPESYVQVVADEGPWIGGLLGSPASPLLADLPADYRARLSSALGLGGAAEAGALPELLSAREVEVLAAVSEGLSNIETGRRLHIAASTVKKHLENIYGKLGAHNRLEAVARCRALGLLGKSAE